MQSQTFVGIDVSKDKLDIAIGSEGELWQVTNDSAGHSELVERLNGVKPALIVLEASGGYEAVVAGVLWDAAAWTLLFNVLINAYPVMLQRYNRGRLAARYGG